MYYSQFEQDKFLNENYFKNKSDGYFVDIGAFDGIEGSNSLFFENLGWGGVCIEPNPEKFELLTQVRKCKCVKCAISNKNGTAQFFQIKEGNNSPTALSGLVEEFSETSIARIQTYNLEESQSFDYIDVECKRFNDLIDVSDIDYLSIDTEGNELKILQSIDFKKYNIKSITTENNDYNPDIYDFLVTKNYKLVARLGCDDVYYQI
jgi:FkbM family methyltransferase